jgi:hypothetical protein
MSPAPAGKFGSLPNGLDQVAVQQVQGLARQDDLIPFHRAELAYLDAGRLAGVGMFRLASLAQNRHTVVRAFSPDWLSEVRISLADECLSCS